MQGVDHRDPIRHKTRILHLFKHNQGIIIVPNVVEPGDQHAPGDDISLKHFIEEAAAQPHLAARGVDVEEGVANEEVLVVAEFEDVGVDAVGLGDVAGVGEGLEERWESEVVGENVVAAHVGVD